MHQQNDEAVDYLSVERFLAAGKVTHAGWHDGTGYPLDALAKMNAATLDFLVSRLSVQGWREVEVLAALGTAPALSALRAGFDAAGPVRVQIGLAMLRCVPEILAEAERTDLVCRAVEQARGGDGLDAALEAAQAWHPPAVMDALWRALNHPDAVVVVHVAALLHFLHGLADEPFDLARRADFLRFVADDPGERAAALDQLRARIPARQIVE